MALDLQLSTAFSTVNYKSGGKGVAFGKVAESDNTVELAQGWSLKIGNTSLSEAELIALKALLS